MQRLGTQENRCTAVLNVSTSAQLSFVMEPPFRPTTRARRGFRRPLLVFFTEFFLTRWSFTAGEPEEEAVEYVPYFNDTYLAVAASLNGGNVMQVLPSFFTQGVHQGSTRGPRAILIHHFNTSLVDPLWTPCEPLVDPSWTPCGLSFGFLSQLHHVLRLFCFCNSLDGFFSKPIFFYRIGLFMIPVGCLKKKRILTSSFFFV